MASRGPSPSVCRHEPRYSCSPPAGYTLFELMLVVAILTILGAVVLPSIGDLLQRQSRADLIGRIAEFLDQQRTAAIREGESRWVRYSSAERFLLAGPAAGPAAEALELPEDYFFSFAEQSERLDAAQLPGLPLEASNLNWSPAIEFRHDGTSSGTQFDLEDRDRPLYRIEVRALTGQIEIQRVNADGEVQ